MRWKSKSGLTLVGAMAASGIVVAYFYMNDLQATADALDAVMDDTTDSGTLVAYLSHNDPTVVSNTLTALEARRSAAGKAVALKLLGSDHEFVWLAATMYLGSLGERGSIPHLIRRLGHPAWRGRTRAAGYLTSMTGQDHGVDERAWATWWLKTYPGKPLPSFQ